MHGLDSNLFFLKLFQMCTDFLICYGYRDLHNILRVFRGQSLKNQKKEKRNSSLGLWQFHFSSMNWSCSNNSFHVNWMCWPVRFIWTRCVNQFISSELDVLTSSLHLNWNCQPVHFSCVKDFEKFISTVWRFWWIYSSFSSAQTNWSPFPVQMKWTGQHIQFRWNELVSTSSSDELELKIRFFGSVHANYWTWVVTGLLVVSDELWHNISLGMLFDRYKERKTKTFNKEKTLLESNLVFRIRNRLIDCKYILIYIHYYR